MACWTATSRDGVSGMLICATGGKLGNEPPIVWGPRLAMDDDGCPADADVGNEVRRRNLLPVVVEAFPDGYVKLDRFVSEHSF